MAENFMVNSKARVKKSAGEGYLVGGGAHYKRWLGEMLGFVRGGKGRWDDEVGAAGWFLYVSRWKSTGNWRPRNGAIFVCLYGTQDPPQ